MRAGVGWAPSNAPWKQAIGLVSLLLTSFLCAPIAALAALEEANGNNPTTLTPAVSIGGYYDIVLQLKNKGASAVNITSYATTGPFSIQWNGCGSTLAAGASCGGNIGIRFTPTAAGQASGSLVVANDSPEGTFTLKLQASGTTTLAPTVVTSFSPASIYAVTGSSKLIFSLSNPNAQPLEIRSTSFSLPNGIRTAPIANESISCGGVWAAPLSPSLGDQSFLYVTWTGAVLPGNGTCTIALDVAATGAVGAYTFTPQQFALSDVWSTMPSSAILTVVPAIAGIPGAPSIVSVQTADRQASVSFSPPSDGGASPITGYTVTSWPAGGIDTNAGSTVLNHVVTGLANGTTYKFLVTATNASGTGPASGLSAQATPATTPTAPSNSIATAENAQAVVTFAAPDSDGGNSITGYTVTSNPPGGVDSDAGSVQRSHRITGLANGTAYTFTVVATNAPGNSASSPASNQIMPGVPTKGTPPQLRYQLPQARSTISTLTPTMVPDRIAFNSFEPAYLIPRSIEFADFNGDGLMDIVVAPGFPLHDPPMPIAIWLNRGDGTFDDGTASVIEGSPPITSNPIRVLVGDFNHDGRPDVFFISTGPDRGDLPDVLSNPGWYNRLLLSQPNGKYKDASDQIAANDRAYSHQGGMGDANGDGHLDIVENVMANMLGNDNEGVRLLYGDGKGFFVDATNALPPSIRFMSKSGHLSQYGIARQMVGCSGLVDVDGDGKSEVITGTTGWPDIAPDGSGLTGTIRIHKRGSDGNYTEVSRVTIPDALLLLEYGFVPTPGYAGYHGPGCALILGGDLNGDGRADLVIYWEGTAKPYIQILRNDGNYQFADITLDSVGSYDLTYMDGNMKTSVGHLKLMDVNGDGTLDIVNLIGNISANATQGHIALLNDGAAHFTPWTLQDVSGPLTASQLTFAAKCADQGLMCFNPLVFDTNGSGIASVVLMDTLSSITNTNPSQTSAVYLTTFAPANLSASATQADCFFGWAETNFPSLFSPRGAASSSLPPYRYRYYSVTNGYLGISSADNRVYYLGALSGNALVNLGPAAPWLVKTSCQ